MVETILLLILLLLVGVFCVVLGVHLQAAKSKTDCGCGGKADKQTQALLSRVVRLERALNPAPEQPPHTRSHTS